MYFRIIKSSDNQYYFTINADNYQVLCTSETYKEKQSAKDTIAVIKKDAANAPVHDYTA
ncbi:MAG: YegP family protein [Bacillota bacterium]|nr:YegP family protein [Bacillota bacterium]